MSDIARKKDTGEPGNGGQFGHTQAAPSGIQLADNATEQHWIYIERQYSNDLAVGPYPTAEKADRAMNHSLLIDSFCEEDCLDAWAGDSAPDEKFERVFVDLNDPDHTGEPSDDEAEDGKHRLDADVGLQYAAFVEASHTLTPIREQLVHSHDRKTHGWCKAHSDQGQEPCTEPALCDVAYALDNLPSKPSGTMRSWMQAAAGRSVHTVQVDHRTGKAWAPTGRVVEHPRAGHVSLGGSRRDYAGMRVIGANDTTLLVSDGEHTIVYVLDSQSPG